MERVTVTIVLVAAVFIALVGSASASECTALLVKVNDEAANRLDDAGYGARQLADEAEQLDKQGKTAECEAKVKEAMKQLGI